MQHTHTHRPSAQSHHSSRPFFAKGSRRQESKPFFAKPRSTPAAMVQPQLEVGASEELEEVQAKTVDSDLDSPQAATDEPPLPPVEPPPPEANSSVTIQTKLTIGQPDDPYEQEADQVADQVMRMPEPTAPHQQASAITAPTPLQLKSNSDSKPHSPSSLEARLNARKGQGRSLPEPTQSFMESRFGQDFSQVRVHADSEAAQLNQSLNAQAFTYGRDVLFGAGKYRPDSETGQQLIAHELTHVLQQTGQRPSVQRAVLGQLPEGASTDEGDIIFTVPGANSISGILKEFRTWMDKTFDEKIAAGVINRSQAQEMRAQSVIGIVTNQLALFKVDGTKIGTYQFEGTTPNWPAGYYFEGSQWLSAGVSNTGFDFSRFRITNEAGEKSLVGPVEWLGEKEVERIRADLNSDNIRNLFLAVPVGGSSEGDSEEGQLAWGQSQVTDLKRKLKDLAEAAGSQAGESQTEAGEQRAASGETAEAQKNSDQKKIPDRVVFWQRESDKTLWINVWADGAHEALKLREGESPEDLLTRVQQTTEALREARDPEQSTQVAEGAEQTGLVDERGRPVESAVPVTEETANPAAKRIANTPAYPAEIINYGSPITVLGATNRFQMKIDYRPAGAGNLNQVTARMQRINYYWELIDVTNVHPSQRAQTAKETAVGQGDRLSRLSGTGRDLERDLENVGEDFVADVEDLASGSAGELALTWQARAAWLGVVGLSSGISTLGSVVSSYIDIVTTPRNEQSIGFSDKGEFLVRCVATPEAGEDAQVIRASSVAVYPIKVVNINERATAANDKSLEQLKQLKAELAQLPEGDDREALKQRIAALEVAEVANVEESGQATLTALKEKRSVLQQLEQAISNGVPTIQRSPQVRLLDVQLQLMQIPRAEYRQQLETQINQVEAVLKRADQFTKHFKGKHYRPHVTLASEENGSVTQMLMLLGEAKGSREGDRRWVLIDITSAATQQVYDGESSKRGLAGHQEAIRNAFVDFRENAEYGRGTIAIRLPATLSQDLGGDITIDTRMRAAPGTKARAMQRLTHLAEAAAVAGLLISGPAGLAIGAVGGVAGAVVAVDRLSSRHSGQRLKWDFETIMDVAAIVGGVTAIAGAGVKALSSFPRWVSRVERVEGVLHIYGITEMGSQVIVIPLQLEMQLKQIEAMEGLSPGEKSARKAEAILQAVKSGTLTVVSAAQILNVDPQTHQPGRTQTTPPEGTSGTPKPPTPDVAVPRPRSPETPSRESTEPPSTESPQPTRGTPTSEAAPAGFKERPDLQEALGELQGQIKVIEHPTLEGTQVNYRKGKLVIEVGKRQANAQNIRWHVDTARELLRYRGPIGQIRQLISKILQKLTKTPGYGTQGFESRLEVKKLRAIIQDLETMRARIEAHTDQLGSDQSQLSAAEVRKQIDAEIANLEKQLAEHQALVNSYEPGRGFVAARAESPEALMVATLQELRQTFPLNDVQQQGTRIRIDDVIELHPTLVQDLKARSAFGGPGHDLQTLLDATQALKNNGGDRSKLSPKNREVLKKASQTTKLDQLNRSRTETQARIKSEAQELTTLEDAYRSIQQLEARRKTTDDGAQKRESIEAIKELVEGLNDALDREYLYERAGDFEKLKAGLEEDIGSTQKLIRQYQDKITGLETAIHIEKHGGINLNESIFSDVKNRIQDITQDASLTRDKKIEALKSLITSSEGLRKLFFDDPVGKKAILDAISTSKKDGYVNNDVFQKAMQEMANDIRQMLKRDANLQPYLKDIETTVNTAIATLRGDIYEAALLHAQRQVHRGDAISEVALENPIGGRSGGTSVDTIVFDRDNNELTFWEAKAGYEGKTTESKLELGQLDLKNYIENSGISTLDKIRKLKGSIKHDTENPKQLRKWLDILERKVAAGESVKLSYKVREEHSGI